MFTPVRTAIVTPQSRSSSSFSAAKRVAHLRSGADRSQGVVLVQDRDSEHGHHRVADELLDRPFVALDDRLHLVEVAAHHPSQRLGVELLAERGRPRDVGEDDGDDLPNVPGGLDGGQGRAARAAERESLEGSPDRSEGT